MCVRVAPPPPHTHTMYILYVHHIRPFLCCFTRLEQYFKVKMKKVRHQFWFNLLISLVTSPLFYLAFSS